MHAPDVSRADRRLPARRAGSRSEILSATPFARRSGAGRGTVRRLRSERVTAPLDDAIRLRAVQDFSPDAVVGFVPLARQADRTRWPLPGASALSRRASTSFARASMRWAPSRTRSRHGAATRFTRSPNVRRAEARFVPERMQARRAMARAAIERRQGPPSAEARCHECDIVAHRRIGPGGDRLGGWRTGAVAPRLRPCRARPCRRHLPGGCGDPRGRLGSNPRAVQNPDDVRTTAIAVLDQGQLDREPLDADRSRRPHGARGAALPLAVPQYARGDHDRARVVGTWSRRGCAGRLFGHGAAGLRRAEVAVARGAGVPLVVPRRADCATCGSSWSRPRRWLAPSPRSTGSSKSAPPWSTRPISPCWPRSGTCS